MSGYTKLFASIVHSTIWREDPDTKVLWVTMLAIADQHGEVMASVPGLADLARIDIEKCESALEKFLSPDQYSRTPDNEGRRIAKIPGGWEILNYGMYREMQSEAHRRELAAERQRRYRMSLKNVTSDALSRSVTPDDTRSLQAEAEAEAGREQEPPTPKGGDVDVKPKASRSWKSLFGSDQESFKWFERCLVAREEHQTWADGKAQAKGVKPGTPSNMPGKDAAAFLALVSAGKDPRVLHGCLRLYLAEKLATDNVCTQRLQVFFGMPDAKGLKKATWEGYWSRAVAKVNAAIMTPAPSLPAHGDALPTLPASLFAELPPSHPV